MISFAEQVRVLRDKQVNDMLNELINHDYQDRTKKIALYERYKNTRVPIQSYDPTKDSKSDSVTLKVNNRINQDFFSTIINTKVGYMVGNPITYNFKNEQMHEEFHKFYDYIGGYELDLETFKFMSCCGVAGRLLYYDYNGKINCMNVLPEECLFIYDRSIDQVQYAMRYYYIDEIEGAKRTPLIRVEFYDENTVTFYIQQRSSDNQLLFTLDPDEEENPKPHGFQKVPLIPFPNNREFMGDAERVLEMIDAYDRQVSNLDSEMEQLRLAYLMIQGAKADKNIILDSIRTGIFGLPQGCNMAFIEKTLNSEAIEKHLTRLKGDIITVAQTVDVNNLVATGQLSGVAIAFMYTGLENNCAFTEQKFKKAFKTMLECYNTALGVSPLDPTMVDINFTRNLPVNTTEIVDTVVKLRGIVSDETLLNLLPFIDDAQWEIDKIGEKETINFDMIPDEDEDEPNREENIISL